LAQNYELPLKSYDHGGTESLWHLRDYGFNVVDSVTDVERKKDL
jgi:hypothetical protein